MSAWVKLWGDLTRREWGLADSCFNRKISFSYYHWQYIFYGTSKFHDDIDSKHTTITYGDNFTTTVIICHHQHNQHHHCHPPPCHHCHQHCHHHWYCTAATTAIIIINDNYYYCQFPSYASILLFVFFYVHLYVHIADIRKVTCILYQSSMSQWHPYLLFLNFIIFICFLIYITFSFSFFLLPPFFSCQFSCGYRPACELSADADGLCRCRRGLCTGGLRWILPLKKSTYFYLTHSVVGPGMGWV